MKYNSVVVFTDDTEKNRKLIDLLETMCTVNICSFDSESWADVDLYSQKNMMFIIDEIPSNQDASWILSKLSEDNIFANVPTLFITYNAMYTFENLGFLSCASDVLPQPFNYELARCRIENISGIFQLKQQIQNLTQIHTKRILNQATKLKEQNNKIQTMNFDLVELLVAAIESRDLESGQHIKRIRYFTKALVDVVFERCPEYGLTSEQAEYIYYASSVHDIGKIAIPDAIMLKPGRLTREEYEIMKTHTTRGAKLLSYLDEIGNSLYFQYCKDICLYHHERWDGHGYPKGLKGDATPISAQIVAVADCYDALTSDRPYKSALSHQEAVDLIIGGACGVFSPQLLNCFRAALPEFARIEEQFKSNAASDKYDYTVTDFPHEPPHDEPEVTQDADSDSSLNECDASILSSYDVVFECDIADDYFEVTRGTWTELFPYVPKNFAEASAQCLKICHTSDAARFSERINIDEMQKLVLSGKRKMRVEFRAVPDSGEKLIVGFLTFAVDNRVQITHIYGAFNVYSDDEIINDIHRGFSVKDGLTGLALGNQMGSDVDKFLSENPESSDLLIYIDIDEMSMVNNIFGYEYGNLLIKEFAAKLRELSSQNMLVGKSIADKFILFVKDIRKQSEVILFIEKLHTKLRKPYHTHKENGVFTATMGIARYPQDGKNFKQLYIAAEYASKSAKINGRSAYAFFNHSMKSIATFAADLNASKSGLYTQSDYEPRFAPVVRKMSRELVCYDYIPFSVIDDTIPVNCEMFYELNKNSDNRKNISVLSVKSLLFMLIGMRNNGMTIPPISVYTLLTPDDVPGFVQEMKAFSADNDFSGIDVCIMIPQDFLENISIRKLKTFSTVLAESGFSLGLYLVGTRYVHNNCFSPDVFKRFVLSSDFIERSVSNDESVLYSAKTLKFLSEYADDVIVPESISDIDAEKFFKTDAPEFSETLQAVIGIDALHEHFTSFKNRAKKSQKEREFIVRDLNPDIFLHDLNRSNRIAATYDINEDRVGVSANANLLFGFDIISYLNKFTKINVDTIVHPDDVQEFVSNITKSRITLMPVVWNTRLVAADDGKTFKNFCFSIVCVVDTSGTPQRFQCIISPVSE